MAVEHECYSLIGGIATEWSLIEQEIHECIWLLAKMEPLIGACVTSQMYSTPSKTGCLMNLLYARKVPKHILVAANKIINDSRKPLEIRNRVIHDPLMQNEKKELARFQVTAKVFSMVPVTVEELFANYNTILEFKKRVQDFASKLWAVYPTLPEIPIQELRPIIHPRYPDG